jgi:hypothetical protein
MRRGRPMAGLTMNAGDGDDLARQVVLVSSAYGLIPLALHDRVLPQAGSRLRKPSRVELVNRDFCSTGLSAVTEF